MADDDTDRESPPAQARIVPGYEATAEKDHEGRLRGGDWRGRRWHQRTRRPTSPLWGGRTESAGGGNKKGQACRIPPSPQGGGADHRLCSRRIWVKDASRLNREETHRDQCTARAKPGRDAACSIDWDRRASWVTLSSFRVSISE